MSRAPTKRSSGPRVSPMSGDRASTSALIAESDRRIARAIAGLAETTPDVELALQLVVRGLRLGHVCVNLSDLRERLELHDETTDEGGEVGSSFEHWPTPAAWRKALAASPLVRTPSQPEARPLVLDGTRVYLDRMYRYEQTLAAALRARVDASGRTSGDPSLLASLQQLFGASTQTDDPKQDEPQIDRQRLGAMLAALQPLTVIAGGPGTGKTTTVKKLLLLLLAQAQASGSAELPRIALAAPTGKAAARLRESINEGLDTLGAPAEHVAHLRALEAKTVHRLLGPRPDSRSRFRHSASNPTPFDIVVVDEASMIPLSMMAKLFDATAPETKLVLLGDRNQLASVEAGSVLGDICGARPLQLELSDATLAALAHIDPALEPALHSDPGVEARVEAGIWDAIVTLDRVHRFDAASGIGQLAAALQRESGPSAAAFAVLEQSGPQAKFQDLHWCGNPMPGSPALDHIKRGALASYGPLVRGAREGRPAQQLLTELDDLRILCAHRQGLAGSISMGARVEAWLADEVPGYEPGADWPLGRPILVLENDHELRLYNGDVGLVVRHPSDPERPTIAFPDAADPSGVRLVSPGRLPRHETVFTMSIHKSQGSQFKHAMVLLPRKMSRICTRELVYTGITRARQRLTIAAEPKLLRQALDRTVQRGSGLREALW